jgi:hypothetical protein
VLAAVLTPDWYCVIEVLDVGDKTTTPDTSQSPGVNVIDVTFATVLLLRDIGLPGDTELEIYSPRPPVTALSLVAVPLIYVSPKRGMARANTINGMVRFKYIASGRYWKVFG